MDRVPDTGFLMILKALLFRKDHTSGILRKPYEFVFEMARAQFPNALREPISPKCVPLPTFLDDSDEGHQSSESSRPPFRANSGNSCSRWTGGTSVEKSEIRHLAKP